MIEAISKFQPNSNWITAGLLTLFVVSFALVAQGHVKEDVNFLASMNDSKDSTTEFCRVTTKGKKLLRY